MQKNININKCFNMLNEPKTCKIKYNFFSNYGN